MTGDSTVPAKMLRPAVLRVAMAGFLGRQWNPAHEWSKRGLPLSRR